MTDQDFIAIQAFARTRGAVARFLHPLLLVITTPEYEESNALLKSAREGEPAPTQGGELFSGQAGTASSSLYPAP